ncbi:MAG: hypothetical protein SFZ23_05760 [Planctomycetota bacterium]|nr:hypothetical protein [Planctomycetota bacterium]
MITPAPTSKVAPGLARGVLHAVQDVTATKAAFIVFSVPGTNYELHLRPLGTIATPVGKRILGRIRAKARRVDTVMTGGRYVEPVYGRPRRVQGSIVEVDAEARTITVNAGVPIVCTLTDERQSPGDFAIGHVVSFDVLDGSTFEEVRD